VPLPPAVLTRWRAGYASLQPLLTGASALLPVAVLDLLIVGVGGAVLWLLWRRRRSVRVLSLAMSALVLLGLAWLSFLALWGWHYQVPTLESRLGLQASDVAGERGEAFAHATVRQLNGLHAAAHAAAWPAAADMPRVLAPLLARVLPRLEVAWTPAWPRPRRTLLDWYFRAAGIDGMTNPFGLEILLNSRVLPIELPALAAHEYAHLAGFADEADASVVAWLACQGGGPALRYSSALAMLPHLLTGLPRETQRAVIGEVGKGPRADLRAIAARLAEQRPWVHAVAWQSYDRFLRANHVADGIARYDAVARVLIGGADPTTGSLRRWPRQGQTWR
jgi:hypothetical protein